MKGRHDSIGVLYLDTKSTAKDIDHEARLRRSLPKTISPSTIAVAHQAVLAVEETHYHQALVQAERLAAIGQTIAALSHHIKNILQGLRSGSDILKMGLKDKNENLIQQGYRIAEKNQAKIYDLVMDMLSYSKERVPAVEETDLNELVKDIHELLAPRAKEMNVALEMTLADDLPIAQADPEGIHRALLNIVGNAIDAVGGPHGSTCHRRHPALGRRLCRASSSSTTARAFRRSSSRRYSSLSSAPRVRGTGLGLPVSRKILREHGGDLLVQSQLEVGTTFVLKLPIKSILSAETSAMSADISLMPPPEAN